MTRSLENLIDLGNENLHFLNNSLIAFEKGQLFEIKRIASTIRTLIHDTNYSISLIRQIENHPNNRFAEPMMFFDRGGVPEGLQSNVEAYIGCQIPRIKLSLNQDEFLDTFRLFKDKDHWWNRMILAAPRADKKIWSRRDLVLKYANKEGGSHVDPKIPTELIEAQNSMKFVGPDNEIGVGYVVIFEAGISMIQSLHSYMGKVKKAS